MAILLRQSHLSLRLYAMLAAQDLRECLGTNALIQREQYQGRANSFCVNDVKYMLSTNLILVLCIYMLPSITGY